MGPSADDYKNYEHHRHVYEIPDSYIGNDTAETMECFCYYPETGAIKRQQINFIPGVIHLFIEVITNGTDNVGRSRKAGINPYRIEVTTTSHAVTIKNYGLPIPIDINRETGKWAPDLIFGTLLSSSNYDKKTERQQAGRNGLGVKLANIFSVEFFVTVGDPLRGKLYKQRWARNMVERGEPIISEYPSTSPAFVEVTYICDFARFGINPLTGYPPEIQYVFAGYCAMFSFNADIPFIWNGHEIYYSSIINYAKAVFGKFDKYLIHYEWPPGTPVINHKDGTQTSSAPGVIPTVRLLVADTPHLGEIISSANYLVTPQNGVHVDSAVKAVTSKLIAAVNGTAIKRKIKKKDVDGKESKEDYKGPKITVADVKCHISLVLACMVINPKHESQTKKRLVSPSPNITIDDRLLKNIDDWQLVERLYAALDARDMNLQNKLHKRTVRIHDSHSVDAYLAERPGPGRKRCYLMLFEGKSASGYGETMIANIPEGKDIYGTVKLKGKLLNAMNAPRQKAQDNEEFTKIKTMLGLMDTDIDYRIPQNFNTLRYQGGVIIMADSDDDGKHIIGLIYLFFFCKYPSLLSLPGFITFYRTPILRVTKYGITHKFLTMGEYNRWREVTPDHEKWKTKYFKGLGSSEPEHVIDDMKTPRIVKALYDEKTKDAMELAFSRKLADRRKEWIANYRYRPEAEEMPLQPISIFVDQELIQHSIANILRSIPGWDGLKEVERKILYAAMSKWKIYGKEAYSEAKIGRFAPYVADKSQYHHGDMVDVVVAMAQNFVGSNNLPYFTRKGQLGSRAEGGKDAAAPRYTFTTPEWWLRYMYPKEDQPLLKDRIIEGEPCEPAEIPPLLPMCLINGANGIATGHSTFIPCYNPLDVIEGIRCLARGEEPAEFVPWYRGFNGTITIKERKKPIDVKIALTGTLGAISVPAVPTSTIKPEIKIGVVPTVPAAAPTVPITFTPTLKPEIKIAFTPTLKPEIKINAVPLTLADMSEIKARMDLDGAGNVVKKKKRSPRTMITRGEFVHIGGGSIAITELPIQKWTTPYIESLNTMKEEGKIKDYRPFSRSDYSIYIEIQGMNNPSLINLHLQKSFGLTNMVLLDRNGMPKKYATCIDILKDFYNIRLEWYDRRKAMMLDTLENKIAKCRAKMAFIQAVNEKKIIPGMKKKDIFVRMDELGLQKELLDKISIANLSHDDVIKLQNEIDQIERNIIIIRNTRTIDMWLNDIDAFETAYRRYYKLPQVRAPAARLFSPVDDDEEDVEEPSMMGPIPPIKIMIPNIKVG